jgi:hypothetical protein
LHPLEPIDWRLERADEHLATLDRERRAFFDDEDRRIVGHFDRDASEYVFRHTGDPPNPRLGLVVGEFAHHLRAALDNLLWQLVLLRGGSPTRQTQFPIYESRERYRREAGRMIRGVGADDRALIEAAQPYKHGIHAPDSYLTMLAWLNNVDKHRYIHVAFARPRQTPIKVSYGPQGEDAGFWPWNPRFVQDIGKITKAPYVPSRADEDSTELLRVPIEPSGPNPQMKVDAGAAIEISPSDPKHRLTLADLRDTRALVAHVIGDFRPAFDI